jgi:adenylylsulfate kinase
VWLTGLSGAGKSTLALGLQSRLREEPHKVEVLDGDAMRQHICSRLGFTRADRDENVRRIAFVAELLARNGVIVIVAAISPYRGARDEARSRIAPFIEVHVATPLEECAKRDSKGLYAKALRGEIQGFTGVSDPYEPPLSPEIVVDTTNASVDECVSSTLTKLRALGVPARVR